MKRLRDLLEEMSLVSKAANKVGGGIVLNPDGSLTVYSKEEIAAIRAHYLNQKLEGEK